MISPHGILRKTAWACLTASVLGQAPQQQSITTVAGRDSIFSTGGTSANATALRTVSSVAADGAGNVYLAAPQDKVVLKRTSDGRLTLVAGNGFVGCPTNGAAATISSLREPQGVALDSGGNLYIADRDCNRVYKVTFPAGIITTVAGSDKDGFGGDGGLATRANLADPTGVSVGPDGSIYIADSGNSRIRHVTPDGVIRTIAGNNTRGFSGDGGPATDASLAIPMGVALDTAGNVYIADSDNGRVRIVTSDQRIATFAGSRSRSSCGDGGPATSACLGFPTSIAVDVDGVYIADLATNTIRKVDLNNTISTFAGSGDSGYAGDGGPATAALLNAPTGVAAQNGEVFIADANNGRVRKISGPTITTIAGTGDRGDGGPARDALLSGPRGVDTDSAGNIYIADTFNHRIRRVSPDGTITTVAGDGNGRFAGDGGPADAASLNGPTRVIVDAQHSLYIADSSNGRIRKVDTDGIITTFPPASPLLNDPRGMTIDDQGNLYIAENAGHRIRKVSADGVMSTVVGTGDPGFAGDGGLAIDAQLNGPTSVATDSAGNLYIADSQNTRIREVNQAGIIRTIAGTAPSQCIDTTKDAAQACFGYPTGMRIDGAGALYIADYVIWKVTQDGALEIVAGSGKAGFSGDGGPAVNAALASPSDVALGPSGNLYIADTRNNRIRAVVAAAPAIGAAPASLTFSASARGPVQVQDVQLTSSVSGVPFAATINEQNGAGWLHVEPTAGTAPTTLHVSVDPANLANSQYRGTITLTSAVANVPQPLAITVNVGPPVVPQRVAFQPDAVTIPVNSGTSQTQTISVLNQGSGSITLALGAVTNTNDGWLSVSPSALTIQTGESRQATITARALSLPPGNYLGQITATISPAELYQLPVSMVVGDAKPSMLLSATALWFDATVSINSGTSPPSTKIIVISTGNVDLSWTASVQSQGGCNRPWLIVDSASNPTIKPGGTGSFVIRVETLGLLPGTCTGTIQVAAPGAASPLQVIPVTLRIANSAGDLAPRIDLDDPLVFSDTPDGSIISRTIRVQSRDLLRGYTISVSAATSSGQPWLDVRPQVQDHEVKAGEPPFEIAVRPRFDLLSPGYWQGIVTITVGSTDTRTYNVVAIVTSP